MLSRPASSISAWQHVWVDPPLRYTCMLLTCSDDNQPNISSVSPFSSVWFTILHWMCPLCVGARTHADMHEIALPTHMPTPTPSTHTCLPPPPRSPPHPVLNTHTHTEKQWSVYYNDAFAVSSIGVMLFRLIVIASCYYDFHHQYYKSIVSIACAFAVDLHSSRLQRLQGVLNGLTW